MDDGETRPAAAPLAEVTRSVGGRPVVESRHAGHVVVVRGPVAAAGRVVVAHGDPDRPTFVRSAAKPFQAAACLELLERDGRRAQVPDDELAVAWSSHRGEQRHLAAVRRLLARSGTAEDDLTCPPGFPQADQQWPPASPGEPPTRLRFNCSGKHALFALAGRAVGLAGPALLDPTAPLQRHVLGVLDEAIGPVQGVGVDGCGAPAIVAPLVSLARGYRSLAVAARWRAVREAGFAHPGLVGGEGRLESSLLTAGLVAKVGAEAVYGVGWIDGEDAVGLAVKAEDGTVRAASAATIAVLEQLGAVGPDVWRSPPMTGGGEPVGGVRAAAALTDRVGAA